MGDTHENDANDQKVEWNKWVLRVLGYPVEIKTAKFGKELGKGQFGKAFLLKDDKDQPLPLVAKTALNDETSAELRNEAEFYGKAGDHPNIARCYGILPVDGQNALVMEAIKGRNMSGTMDVLEKLRTGDASTLAKYGLTRQISQEDYVGALQYITLEMLKGLAHLEEKGIVHKDIRPDNVMIDQATGQVKLIDFGVAQDANQKTRGKSPVFAGSVSPDAQSDAPLTSKHDMFALGEATRKTMEADQFRYLTGKDAANLTTADAKAFGDPDAKGAPKQALNPRDQATRRPEKAPNKATVRVAEIAESAGPLLADQYVSVQPASLALADQLKLAQTIERMEAQEADQLIAKMEKNLAELVRLWPMVRGGTYDPQEPAKKAIRDKLAGLLKDPSIARTETGQRLARLGNELTEIENATRRGGSQQGKAPDPVAIQTRLREIRNEVDAADADLKRTGTYGAETDYTRFVNWMMHPDPTKRPSAQTLLKLIEKLDAMDADEREAALEKIDPKKKGGAAGLPIRFLADRIRDASAPALLSSVLGKAETAEPPPQPTQPQPTTVSATTQPPNPGPRRRAIFDDVPPPEMKSQPSGRGVSGVSGSMDAMSFGKMEGKYSSPPGGEDDEKAPKSSTRPTKRRGDVDKPEGKYSSPPDGEDDEKAPRSSTRQTKDGGDVDKPEGKYSSPPDGEADKRTPIHSSPTDDAEKKPTPTTRRPLRKDDDEPKPPGYV